MPRKRRRVRLLRPKLLPWQKEAIRRTTEIERRGGLNCSTLVKHGRRPRYWREKEIFLTFETPSVLEMALGPPSGPIFPDDFSNSTPWDISSSS